MSRGWYGQMSYGRSKGGALGTVVALKRLAVADVLSSNGIVPIVIGKSTEANIKCDV